MTGAEHYRKAESLLVNAATGDRADAYLLLVEAQAHATLALAAATAESNATDLAPAAREYGIKAQS